MKFSRFIIAILIMGAFYVGLNYDKVEDTFNSSSDFEEVPDQVINNMNETTVKKL